MVNKMTKVIVLRTAGTNCDAETQEAFRLYSKDVDLVHINELKSRKKKLSSYHILAIPGGFTYGDDIAAGKILANELKYNLKDDLIEFVRSGKLIIGICNGFQVLLKAGLLPDFESFDQKATLILNDSGRFEDRWVYLKTVTSHKSQVTSKCVWTRGINEIIYLPVAHAEGKFITDKDTLGELKENNQIVFQYVDREGRLAGYPYNPNGSIENIAGICDKTGHILGLMPHPERFINFYHHPHWQRIQNKKSGDGSLIFKNGVDYIKRHFFKDEGN